MKCFPQSTNYARSATFASMNHILTSNPGSLSTSANHPDFHFHIFIDFSFSYFSCIFSTYWNLMLWYIKHIYFQKLLIYVKVRDTNLAICFFQTYGFLLWDSDGYKYWRGKKRKIMFYAAWQRLNVNVQDAELIFKNISSKTSFGVSQVLRWPKMFFNLQNNGILSPIFYGFAVNHADTMKI